MSGTNWIYTIPDWGQHLETTWVYGIPDWDSPQVATSVSVTISGEIPMPTGALTASHSQSVTVAGEIPMPTGALNATHDQSVAIAGDMPMPTGAITATHAQNVALSGTLPMPSGDITVAQTTVHPVNLSGTIPMPTGAISASHSQSVTVDGSLPMPFGDLYDTVPVSGVAGGAARRNYVPSLKPGQSQNWFKINREKMLKNDDDEVAIIASISIILASIGSNQEEVEYANA